MVPGLTDTECRITALRYQALLVEGDRQRQAASAAPASQVRVMEAIQLRLGAVLGQLTHLLQGVRTQEAPDPTAAPVTLAVN